MAEYRNLHAEIYLLTQQQLLILLQLSAILIWHIFWLNIRNIKSLK